ncbi:MAG: hypothetical protein NVSMB9_32050 [Isosphaeraceae bacterium]
MKTRDVTKGDGGRAGGTPLAIEPNGGESPGLASLLVAVSAWVDRGQAGPLTRWLERTLDRDGVPRRLAVAEWAEGLRLLLGAVQARPLGWPDPLDALAEGWFRALLRFSRRDGAPVFGPEAPPTRMKDLFREWANRLSEPGLSTVVDWWFPPPLKGRHAPPPLPADARPDRPLAILRANWARDGDLLAIDHRAGGLSSLFALVGQGNPWLGPTWTSGEISANVTRPRPTFWVSQGSADVVEWAFRVGPARVTRTAVLRRGRRLALLGEQWDGPGDPGASRFGLAEGIDARPTPESRGLALISSRSRSSARAFPISLPRLPYPTDRGDLGAEGRDLVLRQRAAAGGKRVWRPLLVSWDSTRNRRPVQWRTLTVSEKTKTCSPDVAFAARISWGRNESLLIYRSLARPAIRAFLGHQTRARFLVGLFTSEGEVEPLVRVEE